MFGVLFVLAVFFSSYTTLADDFHPLYRGVRATGMGGAAVAIADDEEAIFYNPAGLGSVKAPVFNVASITADISNDLLSGFGGLQTAFSSANPVAFDSLIGQDLYGRVQGVSSLLFPRFGVAAIVQAEAGLNLNNTAFPQGQIGETVTYGLQLGYGTPIVKFKHHRGFLRFGVAPKLLWRSGSYQNVSLTQLLTANSSSLLAGFPAVGMGMGLDTGVQSEYNVSKKVSLHGGIAITDIGDTHFSTGALPIQSNFTAGAAIRYKYSDIVATLTYDYAHFFENVDWRKKTHIGTEFKFPMLTLYAGLNELHPTYGAALDILLIKITYVAYAEDLSVVNGANVERRQMVQAIFKFDI